MDHEQATPSTNGKLRLSLKRKQQEVELETADGSLRPYTLVEMSGAQRDHWLKTENSRSKWVDGKPQGISDFNNIQATLISYCLKDDKGADVPVMVIADFPASVQKELYTVCLEMNGLTDKAVEEVKKV